MASPEWAIYPTTSGCLKELERYELHALWFQTDTGIDWLWDEPEDRNSIEDMEGDVIGYLLKEFVYTEAGRWSNARIEAYLERQ